MAGRSLGQSIELARRAAGLSREELAQAIGRKLTVVGSYERGTVEPPLSILRTIAEVTETSLIDLLGLDVSPGDLLHALAHQNHASDDSPNNLPIRGMVIGVLVENGDHDA